MTPTYEELLEGSTQWRKTHMGVAYLLSHHGHTPADWAREYSPEGHPGIWCYYLLIPEQMFPHRWQDFACSTDENGWEHAGPAWQSDWFDTEITWSSNEPCWDRKTKRVWGGVKVGCDYNHSWHRDMGYPDTYASVNRDAQFTVEKFLTANPDRRLRCEYTGGWGKPEEFYTSVNGRQVLIGTKVHENSPGWLPAEEQSDA